MDENPPLPREITQGIKPRQPFGSEAEAIKALRKASEIPNKAARILGRDHAAALSRLLQGNEVLELDGLQMSEVLTIPELAWYTMILPEFRAFRLKLQDIALGMSGNMPKQLKSQFSNIFTADGTCRKPEKLLEMYGDITIGMCNHLRLKGYFTFRNGRITELEDL
ncbi:MAG: hypothetical protein Q8P95_02555, partial [bacterium]|nr:hypothetical protein [bacterium]